MVNADPTDTEEAQSRSEQESPKPPQDSSKDHPQQGRVFVRVRPSQESLDVEAMESHLRRLHGLTASHREPHSNHFGRRIQRLIATRTKRSRPVFECLVVSKPQEGVLEYLFSVTPNEVLPGFERILQGVFPDSYELERVQRPQHHPQHVLDPEPRDTTENPLRSDDSDSEGSGSSLGDASSTSLQGVVFEGCGVRSRDWQTGLREYDAIRGEEHARVPLSGIIEFLANRETPGVYQVLLRPKPDWSSEADTRIRDLEAQQEGVRAQLASTLFGPPAEDVELPASDRERIHAIRDQDHAHSFVLNARLLTTHPDQEEHESHDQELHRAHETTRGEQTGEGFFGGVGSETYGVRGVSKTGRDAHGVLESICEREFEEPTSGLRSQLSVWRSGVRSQGIVVSASALPSFFALDGGSLTPDSTRLVGPTPGEQTPLPGPSHRLLENYQGKGLPLGRLPTPQEPPPTIASTDTTSNPNQVSDTGEQGGQSGENASPKNTGESIPDGESRENRASRGESDERQNEDSRDDDVVVVPPGLQSLHAAWFGRTGSRKTTSLITGMLANHEASPGASILIDPKGDGMAEDYMRAHYAEYGHLDDVIYFDCREDLPAFSFFDIRRDLEAGRSRTSAVEDTVEHYIEILASVMGTERFERAVRSPDIIRYVLKAMFDPIHGQDAFSHREFHAAIRNMHEDQTPPPVTDPDLERMLAGVTANQARSFNELMGGVSNRVEKIPLDKRLARIFNHTPPQPTPTKTTTLGSTTHDPETPTGNPGQAKNPTDKGDMSGSGEEEVPFFDLYEYLEEDVVVIFDKGGLRAEAQRVLTLVVLSNLWSALKRRSHTQHTPNQPGEQRDTRSGPETDSNSDSEPEGDESPDSDSAVEPRTLRDPNSGKFIESNPGDRGSFDRAESGYEDSQNPTPGEPSGAGATAGSPDSNGGSVVNVFVEEAASVAVSGLLSELLAQSRGFGCSMTLAMQFPGQLAEASERAYQEVLNNVATLVTGNVPLDRELAERLSTTEIPPREVGSRLRALQRGEWLVRLPAGFGTRAPRPFVLESLPQPPGLQDTDTASTIPQNASSTREGFVSARSRLAERVQAGASISLDEPATTTTDSHRTTESATDVLSRSVSGGTLSPLALTKRLPEPIEYNDRTHGLTCKKCEARYNPTLEGLQQAIECCHSLSDVDADDIPIMSLHLKLSREELQDSEYSIRQLAFLQAVYNAQQLRYNPPEYSLLEDSMVRLQEYTNTTSEDIDELLTDGVLRHDGDHPHRLYSVPASGRRVIGEQYRRGIDYGHTKGDLDESSEHVRMVEILTRYLQSHYQANPDSPVTHVIPYYDLDKHTEEPDLPLEAYMAPNPEAAQEASEEYDARRLDVVGLDKDDNIIVAGEAERINNDTRRAVPRDYDKMADCNPAEAIWTVRSQSAGHDILNALNDPLEGNPRVQKTYAPTTPPQQFQINEPGLTAIYPVELLHKQTTEATQSPATPKKDD